MDDRPGSTPAEAVAYGEDVVAKVRGAMADAVGGEVVGACFVGSLALGDYVPGRSDVDLALVVARPLGADAKRAIVAAVSHPQLACPARGLELVVYDLVAAAGETAGFELNLNTGPGMEERATFDPADEPPFWIVLDRAIASRSGRPLAGPPPSELFAPVPRAEVLHALAESIAWRRAHEPSALGAVLDACRAWRFAAEDQISSKGGAGRWAASRWRDPDLVAAALAERSGTSAFAAAPSEIGASRIEALVVHAEQEVARAG